MSAWFPPGPATLVGIGDDAAVLAVPDGRVVATTDFLIEGRHFRRDWASAADVGHKAAARSLGPELHVLHASTESDIDAAFATLLQLRAGALVIAPEAFFTSRSEQLAALTVRHAVPAIYTYREFAQRVATAQPKDPTFTVFYGGLETLFEFASRLLFSPRLEAGPRVRSSSAAT